ncbi:MAG: methyltransferase domain-containing protein [Hyphomonadaceae bacterium]
MTEQTSYLHTEIEIGCGQGIFLVGRASENPSARIIGIDINIHQYEAARERVKEAGLSNAMIFHAEAFSFLREHVPDETISAFHAYFPSPYIGEIRRHNVLGQKLSGRLLSKEFLRELQRAAQLGASLRFATDNRSYFNFVAKNVEGLELVTTPWVHPRQSDQMLVGSGCERKFRGMGREIYYLQCLLR